MFLIKLFCYHFPPGMDEEAKVGFHEHIFLQRWLQDFPHTGPVRHFMDLVVVGLSRNPWVTGTLRNSVLCR